MFSASGEYIGTDEDRALGIWLWRPEDILAEACDRVTRALTLSEWEFYLGDESYAPMCMPTSRSGSISER